LYFTRDYADLSFEGPKNLVADCGRTCIYSFQGLALDKERRRIGRTWKFPRVPSRPSRESQPPNNVLRYKLLSNVIHPKYLSEQFRKKNKQLRELRKFVVYWLFLEYPVLVTDTLQIWKRKISFMK
jgi:hypothetical protein